MRRLKHVISTIQNPFFRGVTIVSCNLLFWYHLNYGTKGQKHTIQSRGSSTEQKVKRGPGHLPSSEIILSWFPWAREISLPLTHLLPELKHRCAQPQRENQTPEGEVQGEKVRGQPSKCGYLVLLSEATHVLENLSFTVLYNIVWKCSVLRTKLLFIAVNKMWTL